MIFIPVVNSAYESWNHFLNLTLPSYNFWARVYTRTLKKKQPIKTLYWMHTFGQFWSTSMKILLAIYISVGSDVWDFHFDFVLALFHNYLNCQYHYFIFVKFQKHIVHTKFDIYFLFKLYKLNTCLFWTQNVVLRRFC